jgi:peptidoglycan biosynthesis protein MviN/MurJ (putative lipid II flippase)
VQFRHRLIVAKWAILPSIQELIVPLQYRGPFAHYMTLLLPGLCATGIIHFAVNPMFQIGKETAPLIDAALIGAVMNGMLLVFLARGGDASSLAIAQSGAAIASLTALLVFATRTQPHWPAARDLAAVAISTCAMILLLLPCAMPFRAYSPSPPRSLSASLCLHCGCWLSTALGLASFCGIGLR